jgi:hypothetical protein
LLGRTPGLCPHSKTNARSQVQLKQVSRLGGRMGVLLNSTRVRSRATAIVVFFGSKICVFKSFRTCISLRRDASFNSVSAMSWTLQTPETGQARADTRSGCVRSSSLGNVIRDVVWWPMEEGLMRQAEMAVSRGDSPRRTSELKQVIFARRCERLPIMIDDARDILCKLCGGELVFLRPTGQSTGF